MRKNESHIIIKKKNKVGENMDEELNITDDEVTQEIELKEIEARKEELRSKKKKVRFKKNGFLLCIILIVLLFVLGIGGFFGYKAYEKSTIKKIKNTYTTYVITSKNTKLYNKKHKAVGTIQKGYELTLEEVKVKSLKNKYLQIKNSDYYISYKDIKAYNPAMKVKEESYYLPLEKGITSDKEVTFLLDKQKVITLKGVKDLPIERMDKDYYYVNLLGETLKVKKDKSMKEVDVKITYDTKKAEHVSVIYYDKINTDCGEDDTCLYPGNVRAHIKKL